ncbi:polysaccharide biosynthesis protein [Halobacteriovorax sp. DPLXC-1]|uniref:polysaccharide biosynthesis protein n=1 Tax=Halobacteriovorax sp. DPLXC-1 TaxID=3110771 RepID=UPI002FEFDF30
MSFSYVVNIFFRPVLDLLIINTYLVVLGLVRQESFFDNYLEFTSLFIFFSVVTQSNLDSWRHTTPFSILRAATALTATCFSLHFVFNVDQQFLFSLYSVSLVTMLISRIVRKLIFENANIHNFQRTLIVGSDKKAVSLANHVNKETHNIVGFVDDFDVNLVKGKFKVLGKIENLKEVIQEFKIKEVIIIDCNYFNKSKLIKDVCNELSVTISEANLFSGQNFKINKLELNSLLGREPKEVDLSDLAVSIGSAKVCVTGAGGSIGSELVRQLTLMQPEEIVLIENCEYNLFKITNEVKALNLEDTKIIPRMIDITNMEALRSCFQTSCPDYIFHAAAYKHVALVESNPKEAIVNNVLGTKNLLDLSKEFPIKSFILISTDKAVNPTSVMGATKRLCEILLACYAKESSCEYRAVRFGNVLGSSGSLIPIVMDQILNNEKVTITDIRMKRYFMTIPEAVGLVLNSLTVSENASLCVLKMGDPIRIIDIVERLAKTMGKTLDSLNIVFTGMKKGEKLFEELYLTGEEYQTSHDDIVTLPNCDCGSNVDDEISRKMLMKRINEIILAAIENDPNCILEMSQLINETNNTINNKSGFIVQLGEAG